MRYHRLKRISTKNEDAGVKDSIFTPGGEKKRRIHRISKIRKKDSDKKYEGKIMAILKGRGGGSWWLSWVMAVRVATGCGAGEGWSGDGGVRRRGGVVAARVEVVVWSCDSWQTSDECDGHEGGVMVAAVGRQPEEVEARGGEWIWGSGRSGDGEYFWIRPEKLTGKLFRRRSAVAGGGQCCWPKMGERRMKMC
ncbi:hypothetical protein Tco_0553313 [Tanacetum coccineum]